MTESAWTSERFTPTRPKTRVGPSHPIQTVLEARRDLLGNFTAENYKAGIFQFRLFGRQMVILNSPASIKQALVDHHDNYERKSPQQRRSLEYLLGDGLFISDGETWKHRRPLVADIVHKQRVPELAPAMEIEATATADRWAQRDASKPMDVLGEMAIMAACIISRSVFGVELSLKSARDVVKGFAEYQNRIESFNLGYLLGFDEGLPAWRGIRLWLAVRKVQRVIDQVIQSQLSGEGDHSRMLELLAIRQTRSPGAKIDRDALRDEAATIFMAGYETTASTLAWTWYLLANDAKAEAAVHAEIAQVCGDRAPTLEDVPKLAYCRAVIEETLRLYPPVAFLARQSKAVDRIDKTRVEKAAIILVSPWLLQRSPDLWEEPNQFRPERFMGDERPTPYSYIPFAVGPRICPGMNFGLTEGVLCLAVLAQRFKLKLAPGAVVTPQCRLTLRPKGLAMVVEGR